MEQEKTLLHQRDMAQLLYGNSYPGLFISTLASWVLAFGFAPQAMALSKAHWGYLMLGLLGLRLLLSHYWRGRLKLEPACAPCAIRHFAIGLLLTALMWCFFCLYYYPGASQPQLTSSIIVMAALAGGGANVLSGHKGLALSYNASQLSLTGIVFTRFSRRILLWFGFDAPWVTSFSAGG